MSLGTGCYLQCEECDAEFGFGEYTHWDRDELYADAAKGWKIVPTSKEQYNHCKQKHYCPKHKP